MFNLLTAREFAPIVELSTSKGSGLFIKREDLIHPTVSGNKFWKLFYNVNEYLAIRPKMPMLITFGGAYSNHIAATAALGKELGVRTLGIIRGDEVEDRWQENHTLSTASQNGMELRFVTREKYRYKDDLAKILAAEFHGALIIPEGGTNDLAVKGIRHMLNEETKQFDYLCCAVGTGGTIAGLSKFAEDHQKVIGFSVVKDSSLPQKIFELSGRDNYELIDASDGGYGKITEENIDFIKTFYDNHNIKLDPIYTGKMFRRLFELISKDHFPPNARILAFHTGGLQGIAENAHRYFGSK